MRFKGMAGVALIGGVLGAALVWGGAGWQSGPKPTGRIATIDVVRVFGESERQKALTDEMMKQRGGLEEENRARLQKIDAAQAALDKMNPNDPLYGGKQKEVVQMRVEYKNWFDFKQAELGREIATWTWRIYSEISQVTEEIAKLSGYDAVLYIDEFPPISPDPEEMKGRIRSRRVVYSNPAIDVSTMVLEKLNANFRAAGGGPMLNQP
ncbi:MAG: hypothetical protein CHACPFDD_02791 [Phycisphaerae bacterium]|nr:hypothetical protein [Phycisphaerae bacterium]